MEVILRRTQWKPGWHNTVTRPAEKLMLFRALRSNYCTDEWGARWARASASIPTLGVLSRRSQQAKSFRRRNFLFLSLTEIPDHREHLSGCSWPRRCPCWPDRRRPPWRPARRTSYGLGRSPVRHRGNINPSIFLRYSTQGSYIHHRVGTQTSTVRWAMMALWCPSRVSRAIWAISPSDLPMNIWQAVANISLFWPWILTCKRQDEMKTMESKISSFHGNNPRSDTIWLKYHTWAMPVTEMGTPCRV